MIAGGYKSKIDHRHLLWLLWLACLPCFGWAEQLPLKTYTTANGLARDQINRIVRDSRGFLWFATPEGLSRFDGYMFTNYTTTAPLNGKANRARKITRATPTVAAF